VDLHDSWNKREDDGDADGDLQEFDVKKGPGRQMTETEMEDIKTSAVPKITHRAHLRRDD
jgi:hypothetical protein